MIRRTCIVAWLPVLSVSGSATLRWLAFLRAGLAAAGAARVAARRRWCSPLQSVEHPEAAKHRLAAAGEDLIASSAARAPTAEEIAPTPGKCSSKAGSLDRCSADRRSDRDRRRSACRPSPTGPHPHGTPAATAAGSAAAAPQNSAAGEDHVRAASPAPGPPRRRLVVDRLDRHEAVHRPQRLGKVNSTRLSHQRLAAEHLAVQVGRDQVAAVGDDYPAHARPSPGPSAAGPPMPPTRVTSAVARLSRTCPRRQDPRPNLPGVSVPLFGTEQLTIHSKKLHGPGRTVRKLGIAPAI